MLRAEAGLRQVDVAARLGVSRSTLANIEGGREVASAGLLARAIEAFPGWGDVLRAGAYASPGSGQNVAFVIMELTIAYIFLESHSPSEIVQVRKVRATRSGTQHFVLGVQRTDEEPFTTDTQALWGGRIAEHGPDADGNLTTTIEFPAPLRVGQEHEFAIRSWVEQDPQPDTEIELVVTTRTDHARIHLAFHGTQRIRSAWEFGPADDPSYPVRADSPLARPLAVGRFTPVTASFEHLEPHRTYGVGWSW